MWLAPNKKMNNKKVGGYNDIPMPQVVLIEDDPSLRFTLCQTLRRYGFVTMDFSEPQTFFEWLQTVGPCKACLLLDMHLPSMSGLEVHGQTSAALADTCPSFLFLAVVTSAKQSKA